jgi:hypothetical protein
MQKDMDYMMKKMLIATSNINSNKEAVITKNCMRSISHSRTKTHKIIRSIAITAKGKK